MKSEEHRVSRFLKMASVIALGILAGLQSSCSRGDHFKVVSPLGCRVSSWTPEVFSFYGDRAKVMDKLSRFDMKLAERRIYMFMVESSDSADLALFERPVNDSGPWKIWRWKGQPSEASKLLAEETNGILANKGKECVGQETEKLVESRNPVKQETNNPPKTASQAFGDVIAKYPKDAYVRMTVFLLC
jgi:hypothetical protein